MPVFKGYDTTLGAFGVHLQDLQEQNRAAPATLHSLHFMQRQTGASLGGDPTWGPQLLGYDELTMPGFEGTVINPTATDNFAGWAAPIVIGRTPTPRDVIIYSNPSEDVHSAILNPRLNERFVLRHVMPPPRLHLVHSVDVVQSIVGGSMSQDQGWEDTVQLVPYLPPVRIEGLYFQSIGQYDSGDSIELEVISGSSFRSGVTHNAGRLRADFTGPAPDITCTGSITTPVGYEVAGFIYAPGVGFNIGHAAGASPSFHLGLGFPVDDEFCTAVREAKTPVFVAVWAYPASRDALG